MFVSNTHILSLTLSLFFSISFSLSEDVIFHRITLLLITVDELMEHDDAENYRGRRAFPTFRILNPLDRAKDFHLYNTTTLKALPFTYVTRHFFAINQ